MGHHHYQPPQRSRIRRFKRKRSSSSATNAFMLYMAIPPMSVTTVAAMTTTMGSTGLRMPHLPPRPMSIPNDTGGTGTGAHDRSHTRTRGVHSYANSNRHSGTRIPRMNRAHTTTRAQTRRPRARPTSSSSSHSDLDQSHNTNIHQLSQAQSGSSSSSSNKAPTTNSHAYIHHAITTTPFVPDDVHLEIAGHTLGNSHRSPTSSESFFRKVDRDGDGKIRRPELAHFLQHNIGGSAFDDHDAEVTPGVDSILKKLDLDGNDGLDYGGEVSSYWETLDRLLTVDEVADWVVHAVQLPTKIGRIFREHHVTGYDFPELVDNDGKALEEELHIQSKPFRKKIIRLVQARMLGIGSVPDKPSNLRVEVESCVAMKIMWDKSHAEGFSVHKYRVMRRTLGGMSGYGNGTRTAGNSSSSNAGKNHPVPVQSNNSVDMGMCTETATTTTTTKTNVAENDMCHDAYERQQDHHDALHIMSQHHQYAEINAVPLVRTEWQTVCETTQSDETECIDSNKGLERGQTYVYKVQAWSAVGSSHWAVLDPGKEWAEYGCDVVVKDDMNENGTTVVEQQQGMNAGVGRGDASIANKAQTNRSLGREEDAIVEKDKSKTSALLMVLQRIMAVMTFLINFVVAVLTMGSLLLRLQRVGPTYSAMAGQMEPFFPWLLEQVNAISIKYVGMRVVPERFILYCAEDAARHDSAVKRVGLNGYKPTPSMRNLNRSTTTGRDVGKPLNSPRRAIRSRSAPEELEQVSDSVNPRQNVASSKGCGTLNGADVNAVEETLMTKKNKTGRAEERSGGHFQRIRPQKNLMSKRKEVSKEPKSERKLQQKQQQQSSSTESSLEGNLPDSENICVVIRSVDASDSISKPKLRKFPFRRKKSDGRKELHPLNTQAQTPHNTSPLQHTLRQNESRPTCPVVMGNDIFYNQNQPESLTIDFDDHNLCNTCGKRYKPFKRCRHHCARCGETFCHKHGKTTHNNFVSCKVPGDCVCNVCLSRQ